MNLQTAHLIASIQILLRHDEHLIYFLFHHLKPELRLSNAELRKEARELGRDECLLVQMALDLWSGEHQVRLCEIVRDLEDKNILAFIRAILYWREIDIECLWNEELC